MSEHVGLLIKRPKLRKTGRDPMLKINPQEHGDWLVSRIRDSASLLQTINGVELPGYHLLLEKEKLKRIIMRSKKTLERLIAQGKYRPPNV